MNRNFYRLLFSKTRNMLVAVAEFNRTQRKDTAKAGSDRPEQFVGKLSVISLGILLALGYMPTAQANIIADPSGPAGQQPTIINHSHSATQINIQTPSAAGVSHNVYSKFDVDNRGVILNNSRNDVLTELGGRISGNAALAQGEAKIILNQVNSQNPSQLNGMIEVAGKQAQVVITNPSGITCDGCGFINANRVTLSTGQAQLENGELNGYRVEKGEIVVQGFGMNTSSQDYTDIIARTVKLNNDIYTNGEIKITTGRNNVDAENINIKPLSENNSAKPTVALDVAALGGMYADKITLVGTEKGVGVNNEGAIASAGSLIINVNGDIMNSGNIKSGGEMALAAANLTNQHADYHDASIQSEQKMSLHVSEAVNNDAEIASNGDIDIVAGNINGSVESSIVAADYNYYDDEVKNSISINATEAVQVQGKVEAKNKVKIKGRKLALGNSHIGATEIELVADKSMDSSNAVISAAEKLSIEAEGVHNLEGYLSGGNTTYVTAAYIDNQQGTVDGFDSVIINAGKIDNGGGMLYSNGRIKINSEEGVFNNQTGYINGESVTLNVAALENDRGDIYSSHDLTINSRGEIKNGDKGNVLSDGDINISSVGSFINSGAVSGAGIVNIASAGLDNSGGVLSAQQSLLINTDSETLRNENGNIIGGSDSNNIVSGDFINGNGYLYSNGTTAISSSGNINNAAAGILSSNQEFTLAAAEEVSNSGVISSNNMLVMNAAGLVSSGEITAGYSGGLKLDVAKNVINTGGLQAGMNIVINAADLENSGTISAGEGWQGYKNGDISVATTGSLYTTGALLATGRISLQGKELSLNQNLLSATEASLKASRSLNMSGATINIAHDLTLAAVEINSQAAAIQAHNISLTAKSLNNQGGVIAASDRITLNVDTINSDNGEITAAGKSVITGL